MKKIFTKTTTKYLCGFVVLLLGLSFFKVFGSLKPVHAVLGINRTGINLAGRWDPSKVLQSHQYVKDGGWVMVLGTHGEIGRLQELLNAQIPVNIIWRPWNGGAQFDENDAVSLTASLGCLNIANNQKIFLMPWNEPNLPRECGGLGDAANSSDTSCVPLVNAYLQDLITELNSVGLLHNRVEVLSPMLNPSAPNSQAFYTAMYATMPAIVKSNLIGNSIAPYDFERNYGILGECAVSPFRCATGYKVFLSAVGAPNIRTFAVEVGVVDEDASHPEVPDYPLFNAPDMNAMISAAWSPGALTSWSSDPTFAMFSPLSYNPENHDPDWIWNGESLALYNSMAIPTAIETGVWDSTAYDNWFDPDDFYLCGNQGSCTYVTSEEYCGTRYTNPDDNSPPPPGSGTLPGGGYTGINYCTSNESPTRAGYSTTPFVQDPDCPGIIRDPTLYPIITIGGGVPPITGTDCAQITKTPDPACTTETGDVSVNFTLTVRNQCADTLTNITIVDSHVGTISWPDMAPGTQTSDGYSLPFPAGQTALTNTATLNATKGGEPYTTTTAANVIRAVDCTIAYICPIDPSTPGGYWGYKHGELTFYDDLHHGWDFIAPPGTPVSAAVGGTVRNAGWSGDFPGYSNAGYGYFVVIDGNDTNRYYYGHLGPNIFVNTGDTVVSGDPLGTIGPLCVSDGLAGCPDLHDANGHDMCISPTDCNNGSTTLPHLHFEIRVPPYRYTLPLPAPQPNLGDSINPESIGICGPGGGYSPPPIANSPYINITKIATPTAVNNDALPTNINYTITINAPLAPLTNVTVTNTTTATTPLGTRSITTDVNGEDITSFDLGNIGLGGQRIINYTISLQAGLYEDSTIVDTAIATASVDGAPASSQAIASVVVGTPAVSGITACSNIGETSINSAIVSRLQNRGVTASTNLLPANTGGREEGWCIQPTFITEHWSAGRNCDNQGNSVTRNSLISGDLSCHLGTDPNDVEFWQILYSTYVEQSWCQSGKNNTSLGNEISGAWFFPDSRASESPFIQSNTQQYWCPDMWNPSTNDWSGGNCGTNLPATDMCPPTDSQLTNAVQATCVLMEQYHIPWCNVIGHYEIPGSGKTDPGPAWLKEEFIPLIQSNCPNDPAGFCN